MVAVPIPNAKTKVSSSGLGVIPAANDGETLLIGSCVGGVAGQVYTYRGPQTQLVKDQLVRGPLVEAGVRHLVYSGGRTTYLMKVTPTTAGASSAVTQSGGGPAVTVNGATPNDAAQVVIKVTKAGPIGTSTVQISYDGGDTFGDTYATAATITSETGETINFAVGNYVAGETYAYTNTAPALTSGDIATAIDAYIARGGMDPELVRPVGYPALASDSATIATMLIGKIATAEAANKYPIMCMDLPPVDKATIIAAFANITSDWLIAFGGFCELTDLNGRVNKRNVAHDMVPRIARTPVSIDPMRKADDADIDALPGVRTLVPEGAAASTGYHDEASTPGLAAARISCAMHLNQIEGFFGNFLTLASSSSDLGLVPLQRTMRKAQRAVYRWETKNLNKRWRLKATGELSDLAAIAFQNAVQTFLEDVLAGDIEPGTVRAAVVPTNVATTNRIVFTLSLKPFGYSREIEATLVYALSIPAAA